MWNRIDWSFCGSTGDQGPAGDPFGGGSFTGGVTFTAVNETITAMGNQTGTPTIDASAGTIHSLTLTGNVTISSISNMTAGSNITLILTQDGTGGRTHTSTMKLAGVSKTLSTAAGAIDIISIFYDGTNYFAALTKGYA